MIYKRFRLMNKSEVLPGGRTRSYIRRLTICEVNTDSMWLGARQDLFNLKDASLIRIVKRSGPLRCLGECREAFIDEMGAYFRETEALNEAYYSEHPDRLEHDRWLSSLPSLPRPYAGVRRYGRKRHCPVVTQELVDRLIIPEPEPEPEPQTVVMVGGRRGLGANLPAKMF